MTVRVLILLFLVLALSACTRVAGGVAPSTAPLQPGGFDTLGPVMGKHCTWFALGFWPIGEEPSTAIAVRKALEKNPRATALINVSVDSEFAYWMVVGRGCIFVNGTAVTVR